MNDTAPTPTLSPKVACALAAAQEHPEELMHLLQVARLSAMLFDALEPLHKMGSWERDLLCCAALLHDVGIAVSFSGHHKHSLRLIQKAELPALTAQERDVVANVARYHRKAKPKAKHKSFARLAEDQQALARRLAAILRLADGLDRAHENAVAHVEADAASPEHWEIDLYGHGDLGFAVWGAARKAGLFEDVYGAAVRFEAKGPPSATPEEERPAQPRPHTLAELLRTGRRPPNH